jgi:LuxR family maltose regulon positive regulatory protein
VGLPWIEPRVALAAPHVRSRVRAPEVPPHHVRRPRLWDLLEDAVGTPLTMVVAPAGSGKTSLLAAWAAGSSWPTAWLSVEESDRDPAHLLRGLIAAVTAVVPGSCDRALAALRRPTSVLDAVGVLVDDLDETSAPRTVLVVDDAHLVDAEPAVVESLALFLQHLPPWLRVVVASRRDLALPIDRLRARGQLSEVRFPEMRFTDDEARGVLVASAPELDDHQVEATVARAGGWAAGLHLMARAARSARAGDASVVPQGDDGQIRDYIVREVLSAEHLDLLRALADVAVVDHVTPRLARALTGRQDAVELLRQAEARGLFVQRLPGPAGFAIHPLVRAALVAETEEDAPDVLAARHARAARGYEEAGEVVEALDHWLLAGRPRDALRLLAASHAQLYDTGRIATVLQTIASIPTATATADVAALLEYTWCHLLVDRRRFVELVEQLTWWVDRTGTDPELHPRVTMLQAMRATISGRSAEGGVLAHQAIATLGDAWWRDPLGRFAWNMVARDIALSERWDDAGDEVREAEMAVRWAVERRLAYEGTRALGEALAGRPVDALRIAAGVRRAADVTDMTILRFELAAAEAIARRELGDRTPAVAELEALATAPAGSLLYCQVLAAAELVEARVDGGDLVAARADLARVDALVDAEAFGRDGRERVARAGVAVALAEGALDEAQRWVDVMDDPFWAPASAARLALAAGGRDEATAALDAAVPRCERHRVVRSLLRARATADRDESRRHAAEAAEQAAHAALLQTVASEGPDLVQLVEQAAYRVPEHWLDRLRRSAVPGAVEVLGDVREPAARLTDRERDVLRLLASRLTVREIAAELYVSPNTLKFHLKTIYRKLGVGSRAEAADVARRMASIHPR